MDIHWKDNEEIQWTLCPKTWYPKRNEPISWKKISANTQKETENLTRSLSIKEME